MAAFLMNSEDDLSIALLSFLLPQDALRARAASRRGMLFEVGSSDRLWKCFLERDFGLSDAARRPTGEAKEPEPLRQAYGDWHVAARELDLDPAQNVEHRHPWRTVALWYRLKRWARQNAPNIAATLQPPAWGTAYLLVPAEKVAPLVKGFWGIVNGQSTVQDAEGGGHFLPIEGTVSYLGIFGGYSAYDHEVSMHFVPLENASSITSIFWVQYPEIRNNYPHCMVFAIAPAFAKVLFLDLVDGMVYCFQSSGRQEMATLKACAPAGGEPGMPLIRWAEELVHRLESGIYEVSPLRPEMGPRSLGINLFPQRGPLYKEATTRGVHVSGSAVFMLERPRQGWTYSIRFKLVGTEEERGFKTCQLKKRHWIIAEEGNVAPEHVEGDGVIGLFPILNDEGWLANRASDPHLQYEAHGQWPAPFIYQSSARFRSSACGTFGGYVEFIPGTIQKPTGPPFNVRVEPFPFSMPDFLY
mmetsp:Transcript_30086/g.65637  ORF Transcript_30086/g.65637 Transcript_30086/m.65637 type:complete len:471 (+) Transcript_30086:41-1453(+)